MSEEIFRTLTDKDCDEGGVSEVKNGDPEMAKEEALTVTTKTRRLAPAFIISRKDLGADSSRSTAQDPAFSRKKVIRFSRDDMLRLWRPSKILSTMKELPDIVSVPSLDPMSLQPLEQEDVIQLWNFDKDKSKDITRIRGKGRGRGINGEDDDAGDDNEWSRGHINGDKDGPWDDVDASITLSGMGGLGGGLDLADFAAAALKFRSDTRSLGLDREGDRVKPKITEEDEMERLFKEQMECAGMDSIEEDDDEPEWADAYVMPQSSPPVNATDISFTKRSLLLETLNRSAVSAQPTQQEQQQSLSAPPTRHDYLPVMTPLPQPTSVPESWFYRDPQDTVQGPYETSSMRQWHEARYFTSELPIKLRHWQDFYPLGAVFSDSETAFSPGIATSEPFSMPQLRHAPPPMRPLQSEIMDIDIILRQQQELRQQIASQQQQQLVLQEQQRLDEQRRLQLAQMLAMEEQREAAKQQQIQLQIRQQMFEIQEKEKMEKIRQAQFEYEREQQQQQIQLQLQQQQLLLQQRQLEQQRQLGLQRQEELLREQQQRQLEQQQQEQELLQRQLLQQQQQRQQQQQQQLIQKMAPPPPTGSAWGSNVAASPSLTQIQTEESHLRQQQQASRGGSSLQLKSLLGLSSTVTATTTSPTLYPAVEANAWGEATATATTTVPPPSTSLKEILRQQQATQQETAQLKHHQAQLLMQQQVRSAREIAAMEANTAAVIAAASWSGAAGDSAARSGVATKPALSLRDIMQLEEASSAASQSSVGASDSPFTSSPRPAPGSWAAKASLCTSAGGGGGAAAVRQAPSSISKTSGNGAKKTAAGVTAAATVAPTKPVVQGPSFGGGLGCNASELSEWCVAQLARIRAAESGSQADPTEFFGVLEYCATLQSAVEVRETFSAYLGSTTLVSNFASEFLKKKDGQTSTSSMASVAAAVSNSSGGAGTAGSKKKGKKGNAEF